MLLREWFLLAPGRKCCALEEMTGKRGRSSKRKIEVVGIDNRKTVVINAQEVSEDFQEFGLTGGRKPHRLMPIPTGVKPQRSSHRAVDHTDRVGKLRFGVDAKMLAGARH